DLGAAVVEPYRFGLLDEVARQRFAAEQIKERGAEIGVADHGPATDLAPADLNGADAIASDVNPVDAAANRDVNMVLLEFPLHPVDQVIGPALVDEDALAHEVAEHDP